ncbi:MAG: hypothetical protein DHS20C17_01130 [Cyclobacteriaceae bacterium]|nr:MAG: hypothetical protein DHS20C17_01130 [Cyclobacteriaceae bacterium]
MLLVWVLAYMTQMVHAQSSVSGIVTNEDHLPLPGANVMISGTTTGTVADLTGTYTLSGHQSFPWIVQIILEGYITRTIIVYRSGDNGIVTLKEGIIPGDEVSITAFRIPEKSSLTATSVTTLHGQRLEVTPVNGDPTEYLRNMQGVNLIRSGTESSNIELRGAVNVLETSTLVLKDFAPLTAPSNRMLTNPASSLSPLDIDRIEIVRGIYGAIYGPNANSGVVHFITKDAFQHPGTSAMVTGGERNLVTSRVRYANNNGDKWGWKFLANFSQSNDFSIAENQLLANDSITSVVTNQNFETLGGKRWNQVDNLDKIRLYNWSFEAGVEYRANDKTSINYTASLSRARTNITSPMGHYLLGLQRFEQQARLNLGNLFATIYHRLNFGNIDNNGNPNKLADHTYTLNYTAGTEGETQFANPQRAETFLDIALQYRLEVNSRLNFQFGADAKLNLAFENDLVYGVSSGNNEYNIIGGYLSGKYYFNHKFILSATGRYDYLSSFDQVAFSPHLGLVYRPRKHAGIRFGYSRSFEAPSRERTWMDYNYSSVLPPFYPSTRIQGLAQNVTYNSPVTRFPFGDVPGGELFNLQEIIDVAAEHAGVPSPTVSGQVDPAITTASFAAPMVGFPTGFPITLEETVLGPPVLETANQVELVLDYSFKQRLQISAALFHIWVDNVQSTGEVVLSAGSQLNLLEIRTILEQRVPAGPERDALIASLYSVPPNPTDNPTFDGVPGFGVVMSDRAQEFNYSYDLGFPTYENINLKYYGAEISATYFVTPFFSVFGNYSYFSQTVWKASDFDETNPKYFYYLNSPPNRFNFGINFYPQEGIYGAIAMNYQSSFESRQGDGRFFTGVNEARSLFDLQLGYRFAMTNNLLFDLGVSINNLFDHKYSHFINLAQLRRYAALTVKVSL